MYFPVFIDLSEKEILVVGAGTIAARRIKTLCGFAGHITVAAPEISSEIRALAEQYPITLIEGIFEEALLEPGKESAGESFGVSREDSESSGPGSAGTTAGRRADMVLAATNDPGLNRRIASLCRDRGIPVNVCSEKEACDFYFPSVVREGDVIIGINASGRNHSLVKQTRQKLEEFLKK